MTAEPQIVFDEVNERQGAFHRRTFLLGGFAGLGALALTGRLAQLQIVDAQRYSTMSASNQFNFRLRTPPRGRTPGYPHYPCTRRKHRCRSRPRPPPIRE